MQDLTSLPSLPSDAAQALALAAADGLARAREQAARGDYQASCDTLQAVVHHAPLDDLRTRCDALAQLAHHSPRLGRLTASARCAAEALALADRLGDPRLRADALTSQSYVYSQLLMGREGLEGAVKALAAAREARDPEREGWALNRVGVAYASLENPTQACTSTAQALEVAAHGGSAELRFSCLNNLAYYWLRRVDDAQERQQPDAAADAAAQARRTAEDAVTLARSSGSPFQVAVALSNLVSALFAGNQLAAVPAYVDEFGQLAHLHGYVPLALEADAQRAVLLRRQGRSDEAVQQLERLLRAATEPPPKLRRLLMRNLYETCRANGQYREALIWLEDLVALDRQITRDNLVLQTEVILIRDQVQQARARADSALADARRERARAAHLENEQQRLREQAKALDRAAHEDVLTGLHNRRHAEFALPLLVEGARVAGEVLSVAVLDVDHFKQINDTHGHGVGDTVLQHLAQLLRHRLRSADLLARVGGEEFVAVLVNCAPTKAAEICERLRLAVAEHDWAAVAPGLSVRVSIGIAGGAPQLLARSDDLLQRADRALYAAKRGGRNRVHVD